MAWTVRDGATFKVHLSRVNEHKEDAEERGVQQQCG